MSEKLDQLVTEWESARWAYQQAKERYDDLSDQIKQAFGAGTHHAAGHTLQISARRTLNRTALQQRYKYADHPELYKPAIDTALAKQYLTAEQLDECSSTSLTLTLKEPK